MGDAWFNRTVALNAPRLTSYLSVRCAEEGLGKQLALAPRSFDEKLHILEAPALLWAELTYYRIRCDLRDLPIAVAYLDIDDFKGFNTRYTETVVDLRVLTPFMETLEAHIFAFGHAYRFGGHEYVILLPNCGDAQAIDSIQRPQERFNCAKYKRTEGAPTITRGLCIVTANCIVDRPRSGPTRQRREESGQGCE